MRLSGRLPLSRARLLRAVQVVLAGERRSRGSVASRLDSLEVTFLEPRRMRQLNRAWKGHDQPTDVLAFALPGPGGVAGDVYICPAVARAQARELAVPVGEELLRLVIHGTLHVVGHDHPHGPGRTRSAMWRRQERYLTRLA